MGRLEQLQHTVRWWKLAGPTSNFHNHVHPTIKMAHITWVSLRSIQHEEREQNRWRTIEIIQGSSTRQRDPAHLPLYEVKEARRAPEAESVRLTSLERQCFQSLSVSRWVGCLQLAQLAEGLMFQEAWRSASRRNVVI